MKTEKVWKYLFPVLLTVLMAGCVDKDLGVTDPAADGLPEIEGDAIGFMVRMDRSISTRADGGDFTSFANNVESYENYIDTQDKFRVFFFTEHGDFLFGANDRVIGTHKQSGINSDYWYVRIPMSMLVDRQNKEYDVEKIKDYLRNNKFKVAVLANWPNKGARVNPSDYDDSEEGRNTSENTSSSLKGEPNWGWDNSILNRDADAKNIRNINDLHHLYDETKNYADKSTSSDRQSKYYVYGFLMKEVTDSDGDKYFAMGEPTDWVKMRNVSEGWHASYEMKQLKDGVTEYQNKEAANQWIRQNWNPDMKMNQEKKIYRSYQHLWYLWNFHAAYATGNKAGNVSYEMNGNNKRKDSNGHYIVTGVTDASAYDDNFGWNDGLSGDYKNNPWGKEWYIRNGDILYNWMNGTSSNTNLTALETVTGDDSEYFLTFTPGSGCYMVSLTSGGKTYYGIRLPGQTITKVDKNTQNYFTFMARSEGTLRIRFSSASSSTAKIWVSKNGDKDKEYSATGTTPVDLNIDGGYRDYSAAEESYPIHIVCSSGTAVIYSIEFIRGKYLYDTDREGVAPSRDFAIPMYGVRDYEAMKDWEHGTTQNLEGDVYLVRSLAKVELYLPSKYGKPKHVYFRGMNRTNRCEPMDVETQTHLLWKPEAPHTSSECEFFQIQSYGAQYDESKPDKVDDSAKNYKSWLSWFYRSWASADWQKTYTKLANGEYNTNIKGKGWDFQGVDPLDINVTKTMTDRQDVYPHIFNPNINRSDFCEFLYAGMDEAGNYKYVLYMPEHNIDDPNNVGYQISTPKVPHIEYRYDENNSNNYSNGEINLDDADCFRIYFTNYGKTGGGLEGTTANPNIGNINKDEWEGYEKTSAIGTYHWPILRNHIYQFYVEENGPKSATVRVKVTDWSHEKVVVDW